MHQVSHLSHLLSPPLIPTIPIPTTYKPYLEYLVLECMSTDCDSLVPEDFVLKLIIDPATICKYKHYSFCDYVKVKCLYASYTPLAIHHYLYTTTYTPLPIHHYLYTTTYTPLPIHHYLYTTTYTPLHIHHYLLYCLS